MVVPAVLNEIEQSGISMWIRDTDSVFGFYFILLCHTIGLSLLVGANTIVDLRILGVSPDLPIKSLTWLFSIMWTGFWINAPTGLLLVTAYPTKTLTNPLFYIKLTLIGLAVLNMYNMKTRLFEGALSEASITSQGRKMAKYSLVLWVAAITAGRLLAYTYKYLLYGVYAMVFFNAPK